MECCRVPIILLHPPPLPQADWDGTAEKADTMPQLSPFLIGDPGLCLSARRIKYEQKKGQQRLEKCMVGNKES